MRYIRDPDERFPPSVRAGERFVVLSDCDIWDSTDGCEVCLFAKDYRSEQPHDPDGLSHLAFTEASLNGLVLNIPLDDLIDCYLEHVLLRGRAR